MAGFWSSILSGLRGSTDVFTPRVTHLGAAEVAALMDPSQLTVSQMWKSQPHFRTVVTFLARNIAQLGLHSFERVDQNDRRRDRESVLARTLRFVDGHMTEYELKFALVGDLALYDRAFWWAAPSSQTASGWMIRRLPPSWVEPVMANPWEVKEYRVFMRSNGGYETIPAEHVLAFPGYDPSKMTGASPTVDALRGTLQEQVEAARYRAQVWKRGGRVSSVLERPKDAPAWSDEARATFREDWYAKFTGRGSKAGGTPILEDGMTLKRIDFNAQEQQFVEAAKLSLVTVASAFHVNPTMIGQNDGANYSNVREFRKMLYGDTLGPTIAQIEDRINSFLLPRMGMDPARFYVEFNIDEKLQGNFEEQAAALQASTGAPWMTRNEARSVRNLPALEGGDELVTPLNVLIGGQASARDGVTGGGGGGSALLTGDDLKQRVDAAAALIRSGFDPAGALEAVGLDPIKHLGPLPVTVQKPLEPADQDVDESLVDEITESGPKSRKAGPVASRAGEGEPLHVKAANREQDEKAAAEVLRRFFKRQRAAVLSALGSKDGEDWWDAERWDRELADDLFTLATSVTSEIGAETAESLGFDPATYDVEQTLKFLRAVAKSRAGAINSTTLSQVKAALADDVGEDAERATPAGVFDQAESTRADTAGVTLATTLVTFAVTEFGRQAGRSGTTKTWVTTSGNPRPSHAVMDGETVPVNEPFSNGMDWPGDPGGGVDEVAGCSCVVDITIP